MRHPDTDLCGGCPCWPLGVSAVCRLASGFRPLPSGSSTQTSRPPTVSCCRLA